MKTLMVLLACLIVSGCSGMGAFIPSSDVCPNGIDSVTGQCR
ncbi:MULTISPECIES: hypothetical protein [Erwinia]|nr:MULTISPECIES: hypothetical protein [Erwinia]